MTLRAQGAQELEYGNGEKKGKKKIYITFLLSQNW